MVHALKQIRDLLKPGGLLIDIHPSGEPPPIHVHLDGQAICVGWVKEENEFISYFQTDDALAQACQNGWFTRQSHTRFAFTTAADTIQELYEYLSQNWEDMIIEPQIISRAEDLLRSSQPEKEVQVREWIKMTCLQKPAKE
ncbi:MAG: hypothetical protein KJ063_20960 [Anaerolineae bacterium]|nr:hypothetical protein [Anaerolineae bacterium]